MSDWSDFDSDAVSSGGSQQGTPAKRRKSTTGSEPGSSSKKKHDVPQTPPRKGRGAKGTLWSPKGKARAKGSPKAKAKGKAKASAAAERKLCIMPSCGEPRYRKLRWCVLHRRSYDTMKWQAENDTPKPTIAQFDKAMVHDDTAIEAVEAWEEINPPSARWKRKQFMDWAAFEQRHGVRRAKQTEARNI